MELLGLNSSKVVLNQMIFLEIEGNFSGDYIRLADDTDHIPVLWRMNKASGSSSSSSSSSGGTLRYFNSPKFVHKTSFVSKSTAKALIQTLLLRTPIQSSHCVKYSWGDIECEIW